MSDYPETYTDKLVGIGDAWRVLVPHQDTLNLPRYGWRGGTLYNYIGPANYPVPAIRDDKQS